MSSDLKDIPNRLKAMKKSGYGDGFGLRYSFSEMKGWRNEMEDAHCEVTNANMKIENWSFFCVFDGHGGDYCSKKSASHLWEKIYHRIKDLKKETKRNYDDLTEEEIIDAIKSGFYKMDDELRAQVETKENDSQYSSLYPTFLDKSGTTVNGCLITNKHIYLINCGDSRGIFVRRPAQIELVTFDHKPSQLKEKQRIQNAGGMIALNRVNGGLATSRGIGDFEYKCVTNLLPHQQFVSAEPDIYVIERDIPNDYFVVLACDGIWDVKKNDEVLKFVNERVDAAAAPEDLATITNQLIDSCFDSGSKDNMSVILIHFTPKGSNSARSAAAADRRESDRKDKEEQRREQEKKEFNRDFHRQEREEKERERESRHHDDREREKKAKSLTHAIGAYPGAPTTSLPDFNKRKTNV